MNTFDAEDSSSLSRMGVNILSLRPKAPCSVSSSLSQLHSVAPRKTQHASPTKDQPLMNRLLFRYSTTPRELMYAKDSSPSAAVKRSGAGSGEQLQDAVEASTLMLQQETIGMLTRYLPEICEPPLQIEESRIGEHGSRGGVPVLDDRITPQTLHALLHKGRTAASRIVVKSKSKPSRLDAEARALRNETIDNLRKRVSRLEPPHVDHLLQAKVFDRPRRDNDSMSRKVIPISEAMAAEAEAEAEKKEKQQHRASPSERHRHSHLTSSPSRATTLRGRTPRSETGSLRDISSCSFLGSDSGNVPATAATTLTVPLTPSINAGDDSSIVDQVVAYAAARRRCEELTNSASPGSGGSSSSSNNNNNNRISASEAHSAPLFSALDAVLAVSKEYEKVRLTWPGSNASELSASRRGIIRRITALESSLIPHGLWITIHSPTLPGSRWQQQVQMPVQDNEAPRTVSKQSLLFPAANATGRAQVYLLADALDRMLQETPGMLDILADKGVAQRLLPEVQNDEALLCNNDGATEKEKNMDAIRNSDKVHLQYVEAVNYVMGVVDAGLVELVRQLAGSCVERGALLDTLRLVIMDVTSSCLWVVGYCKEQARQEAQARRDLIKASRKDVEEVMALREEVREVRQEAAALRAAKSEFERKAAKYDTLIERLQLKDKNFSKHPVEEHLSLLMELEENYMQSTTKGLEELYQRQTSLTREDTVCDAPTSMMNQYNKNEQQVAQGELYVESYRLLRTLNEALEAVDITCQSLYDSLNLPRPLATSSVASSRWAEIAHKIGSFEVEKKHRQKVFNVFEEWNSSRPNHKFDASVTAESLGAVVQHDNNKNNINKLERRSSTAAEGPKDNTSPSRHSHDNVEAATRGGGENMWMNMITRNDLANMGVNDCSPEEVNALYAPDFDMATYLQPELRLPEEYEMNVVVMRDMVHDVSESLRHITLRMNALANSNLLKEGMKPSMTPPAYPEDACMLCGRRESVEIKRKNRGEALQQVANEIQRRYEALMMKCQQAEAEREECRKEIERYKSREKQQMQEWLMREAALQRTNDELTEENRLIIKRAFLSTNPTPPGHDSTASGLKPPDRSSSSENDSLNLPH